MSEWSVVLQLLRHLHLQYYMVILWSLFRARCYGLQGKEKGVDCLCDQLRSARSADGGDHA